MPVAARRFGEVVPELAALLSSNGSASNEPPTPWRKRRRPTVLDDPFIMSLVSYEKGNTMIALGENVALRVLLGEFLYGFQAISSGMIFPPNCDNCL